MNTRRVLLAIAGLLLAGGPAAADVNYTQGVGTVIFDFTCFTTKHCSAHVPINSSGVEIFTAAVPAQVSLANTGANATPILTTANQGAANAMPWPVSVPTWAGGTLGAMANYGTSPGAVLVPGVNAFVTNAPANGAHNTANSSTVNLATDAGANAAWGQVATGGAPPAGAQYAGANASGATGGLVRGLINCDLHVFKHITSATDTLAVQGVASQTIYICGALANGAGAATAFLENTASANANCSSSNTQIAGNITSAAASASGFYNPIWGGLKNTSGNGLCINSTGTGGIDVDVWYAQF